MGTRSIVYLEDGKSWLFNGETFSVCKLRDVKKEIIGGAVPLSELQVGNFKFSASMEESEQDLQTEIKMHEEGGLDSSLEYEVASFKHVIEGDESVIVESFACSHNVINDHYADVVKKTKTIDWIIPSFISYEAYYSFDENESKTDLFYYIGEDESYAVLFQNGRYIAHRRTLSIAQLAKDIGVDDERCKSFLRDNALVKERYSEAEEIFYSQIEMSFSKQIEKFVHTINHKRGLFGIEKIDRVFIDFDGHSLDGMDSILSAYGMEDVEIHTLLPFDPANTPVHKFLKARYIYLCANNLCPNPLNLSPYERPPVWYKRHYGRLGLVSAAALVAGMLHPGYFYIDNLLMENEIAKMEQQVALMEQRTVKLSQQLKVAKEQLAKEEEKLSRVHMNTQTFQVAVDTLPVMMNARYVRQKMMNDTVDILKQYRLSALSLEQNGTKSMKIHVIADYTKRDNIAKFMKRWIQTGYQDARTKEIYLDENIYESTIEVLR